MTGWALCEDLRTPVLVPRAWRAWPDVVAACSTRLGGRSRGPFATLNVGLATGDDARVVIANRLALLEALGLPPGSAFAATQVHGSGVAVAPPAPAGRSASWPERAVHGLGEADILLAPAPGSFLFATFADCVPVLLLDPLRRAAALAHAGWRGTAARVAAEAVRALREVVGSRPEDLTAALGPAIGPCCYEVDKPVADAVALAVPDPSRVVALRDSQAGKYALDLVEANRLQLVAAGVPAGRIAVAGLCTACRQDLFYSHRGSRGVTGRFAAVLGWRAGGA